MKHELIKKDGLAISVLIIASIIVANIAFSNETHIFVLRTVLSFFWIFVIPGYFLTMLWREKLGLAERLSAGTLIAFAFTGVASYYFGLVGIPIWHHWLIIPPLLSSAGMLGRIWEVRSDAAPERKSSSK